MFRNALFICVLLILASMASHNAMAADSCQPLQNAAAKLVTMPTHIYATTVNNGPDSKPSTTEMIYAKGSVYGKVGGNWMRTNLTPQELVAQGQENQKYGSCHYIKDELVGGEMAAVYSERSQSGEAQAQLWISKSSSCFCVKKWTQAPVAESTLHICRCAMSMPTFRLQGFDHDHKHI